MLSTLRQAYHLFGHENRRRWLSLVVVAVVVSGFETLGAALVYVLAGLVADPNGTIDLPVVGDPLAQFSHIDRPALLGWLVAALAAFFILRGLVRVAAVYLQSRITQAIAVRLSVRLATGYLKLPYSFHLHRNSAELIRNAYYAVQQVISRVFTPMDRLMAEGLLALSLLVLMVSVAPAATGLALAVLGGAAIVVLLVVQPRLKRQGSIAHDTSRETLSLLQQAFHGIRDIKILGRERWFQRTFAAARRRMARAHYLSNTLNEIPAAAIELSVVGFILMYFAFTLTAGNETGEALSVLGLFAYSGLRLQPAIQKLIKALNDIKYSTAPLADLYADLELIDQLGPAAQDDPLPLRNAVVLDSVTFRYEGADTDALHEVNLTILQGEEIGICGPTGGGKSTLVDVISGLLQPTSGRVTIDGRDLADNTREWQRSLGVVSQSVFLLDDTLRRNIALGVPDDEIDPEALLEAVEMSQLSEFVQSLPKGLDTSVGERGVRISGGQRQRIAIARALYNRPNVLIFDEGTSALDNATEAALMSAIERLRGDHTIIVVAHRLSTVQNCDRVIFVEGGRLTGEGTYGHLVSTHRAFQLMAGSSP